MHSHLKAILATEVAREMASRKGVRGRPKYQPPSIESLTDDQLILIGESCELQAAAAASFTHH